MKKYIAGAFAILLLSCGSANYYIVRHAEKGLATTMTFDVPLSQPGNERAQALKEVLLHKKVQRIFSTNYIRTKATAQPLSEATGIRIEIYDPADSSFIKGLKNNVHGNVLIVGHSNTVDDIVNALTGKNVLQDLPDTQYGDLFIVTKRGKTYQYARSRFGL